MKRQQQDGVLDSSESLTVDTIDVGPIAVQRLTPQPLPSSSNGDGAMPTECHPDGIAAMPKDHTPLSALRTARENENRRRPDLEGALGLI